MKLLIIIAVIALSAADDNHYDAKYDNFDVDTLVKNTRLLKSYAHCFIGDGKCTPEGKDMKKWIPEGSRSSCAKCTEKQKIQVAKFMKAIQAELPEEWESLSKQGDPEGTHKDEVQKFIKEYYEKTAK